MEDRLVEANRIVQNRVWWSVAGGLIPVPWIDMAAVTGVQLSMIYALSKKYDVEFKKDAVRNIIASLLGSIVPEALARGTIGSSLKMLPILGQTFGGITMSAFSGATTYAIGKVFVQHFETGGTLFDFDIEKMREYFKEQFDEGKVEAEKMGNEKSMPATPAKKVK